MANSWRHAIEQNDTQQKGLNRGINGNQSNNAECRYDERHYGDCLGAHILQYCSKSEKILCSNCKNKAIYLDSEAYSHTQLL